MQYARKMTLVEPHLMQMLQPQRDHQQNPTDASLTSLDDEMRAVLESTGAVSDKVRLYNQILQKYLTLQGKKIDSAHFLVKPTNAMSSPPDVKQFLDKKIDNDSQASPPSQLQPPNTEGDLKKLPQTPPKIGEDSKEFSSVPTDVQVLKKIDSPIRPRAQEILTFLGGNPNVTWNESGELILHGVTIPKSNISELLADLAVKGRKKNQQAPVGWQHLAQELQAAKIPLALIHNTKRKSFIQKLSDAPDSPPGRPSTSASTVLTRSRTKGNKEVGVSKWAPY